MPISDLAIYSRAQATGVFASSVFVGGYIGVHYIFLPTLTRISVPIDRVSAWSKQYDNAAKIMGSLSGVAGIAFATAAYYAPTYYLQNSMIASALLSFSIAPYTVLAIMPTVKALKGIETSGDADKAVAEGDKLIEKWGKLGLIRFFVMALAALNGLKELSEWYAL